MLGYYPSILNILSCARVSIRAYVRNVTGPKVRQMRANKYEKINEIMPDIKIHLLMLLFHTQSIVPLFLSQFLCVTL